MSGLKSVLTCEAARVEIVALIDGELEEPEAATVQAHLVDCRECKGFYSDAVAVLQITRDAMPAAAATNFAIRTIDAVDNANEPPESDLLIAELRSVRAEMQTMRAEMSEMRKLLADVRGRMDTMPPRPVARPVFPYAAPMDRLRSDR